MSNNKIINMNDFKSKVNNKEVTKEYTKIDYIKRYSEIFQNEEIDEFIPKIKKNKDIKDYLEEYPQTDIYILYANLYVAVFGIEQLDIYAIFKSKEEIIIELLNIYEKNMGDILKLLNKDEIKLLKKLMKKSIIKNDIDDVELVRNSLMLKKLFLAITVTLDVKIEDKEFIANLPGYDNLSETGFLDLLKELGYDIDNIDKLIVHLPKTIKENIEKCIDNINTDEVDNIVNLAEGILCTYGVIKIEEFYDMMHTLLKIDKKKIKKIIETRVNNLGENFEIDEKNHLIKRGEFTIQELLDLSEDDKHVILAKKAEQEIAKTRKQKYTLGFYYEMANEEFLNKNQLYVHLKSFFENLDEDFYGEQGTEEYYKTKISSLIYSVQIYGKMALKEFQKELNREFGIPEELGEITILQLNDIFKNYPNWKKGGKIIEKTNRS